LQQKVAEKVAVDARVQSYNRMKTHYEKAKRLQETLADYTKVLESVNSTHLLKKALDAGEISLIEYMMELSLYTIPSIIFFPSKMSCTRNWPGCIFMECKFFKTGYQRTGFLSSFY